MLFSFHRTKNKKTEKRKYQFRIIQLGRNSWILPNIHHHHPTNTIKKDDDDDFGL